MAMAALARDDEELRNSQYALLELWQQSYQGELLILLPDTFGTTQFLRGAPDWVANWTGQRIDSKDAYVAGDEYIAWLERHGPTRARSASSPATRSTSSRFSACTPTSPERCSTAPRLTISAPPAIFTIPNRWIPDRRIRFSAGWGTLLTNDFRSCNPQGNDGFNPIGLVCKLSQVDGRPAVKLSDNYSKALGDANEAERYRRVFGVAGVADVPVLT